MNYLITNAKVWTGDKNNPYADTVAICGDKIEYAGTCANVPEEMKKYETIDAAGKMLIPAFMDSHTHVEAIARTMWYLYIEMRDWASIDEFLNVVKEYAEEHPKEEVPYIYAYSCPTDFFEQEGIDKDYLDKFVSDRPVFVCDANYHRGLANTLMLELMEIDETVPYDESTSCNYERYEGTNIPNGIIEERAFEFHHDIDKMFDKLGWYPPDEGDPEIIYPVLDVFSGQGITALCDGWTETEAALKSYKELEKQGRLNHYFFAQPLASTPDALEEALATAKEWKAKYEDEYIKVNNIKYFLDGTNELGTGAVIEPFINELDNYGIMNASEDELTHVFERINQEGFGIQIHLVGDRSFRTALNAAERAQKNENENGREYTSKIHLLHCELTHPDDRKRPAELGVYINFTPIWANGLFGDASKQYIGEERFNSMYAFNEMIESGANVNYSADMVDEEGLGISSPLLGIQTGATRMAFDGTGEPRANVKECIPVEELLKGYTINNAEVLGIEDITGSITAGKKANLLLLDRDILNIDPMKIAETNIEMVMFEGKVIKGGLNG